MDREKTTIEKQRVLVIHNEYRNPGGEDVVVENEVKMLRDQGHYVQTYLRSNKEIDQYSFIHKLLLPLYAIYSPRTYRDIRKIILDERIDLVHVHNTFLVISPSVYSAARRLRIPVVQTLHNFRLACPSAILYRNGKICEECLMDGPFRAIKHKCYRQSRSQTTIVSLILWLHHALRTWARCDALICLTEYNKQIMSRCLPQDKLFVKPNFVEADSLQAMETTRGEYFLFVGRLEKEKGIQVAFDAFLDLPEQELLILGSGTEESALRETVKKEGVQNIHLLGSVSYHKVWEYMQRAKAIIVPTQWYEGFGLTAVEGLACGTPVIASNIGNVGSIVRDGVTGIHIDPYDKMSLIAAVKSISEGAVNLVRMGRDARITYEEKYTCKTNYPILMEIYTAAAAKASSSHTIAGSKGTVSDLPH